MTDAPVFAPFIKELDRFMQRVDPLQLDRDKRIPPQFLRDLAELGVFGVTLPQDHGGAELGLTGACHVIDALARRDRAIATTVGLHLGLGTRGLVAFGSADQKARYLPDLASGKTIAAFATTEPQAGSDLTHLRTRATIDDRRPASRLRLTGEKTFVTNGGLAGLYTLTAATSDTARALVLVERTDDGLTIGREENKLGLRGSSTTSLHLECDLPLERLIPDSDHDHLGHILAWGRTAMAAGCAGTAHAALSLTRRHVESRHQFGRPLASQPVVQDQLATMAAYLSATRALVALTANLADQADPLLEPLSLAAKVFASEADWLICDLAVQLHGGGGYIEDTGVALLLRDARITRIFEGANDVLLTRLGQLELTRPMLKDGPAHAPLEALREHGIKLLRDPRRLHRAGRLTMLGLAERAISIDDTAPARHARALLAHDIALASIEPPNTAGAHA